MPAEAWYQRAPDRWNAQLEGVRRRHPFLRGEERDGVAVIVGDLQIEHDGKVLGSFEIEIDVPFDGPETAMPVVREVGGRIPREPARHIDDDRGTACLEAPVSYWWKHPEGLNLREFIDGPVRAYFYGQCVVEATGTWPDTGEWPHGAEGLEAAYRELLGLSGSALVRCLLKLARHGKIPRQWRCPCGSGKRSSRCHGGTLNELAKRVPKAQLEKDICVIHEWLEKENRK